MIISMVNNKGGVGKTTTTVNLAEALARLGKKVLVVDVDGQASASMALGTKRMNLEPSLCNVVFPAGDLKNQKDILSIIRKDVVPNVDLITSTTELYSFDVRYAENPDLDFHGVFKEKLKPLKPLYDFILLDCPPTFTLVTINALVASDYYIVPITPNYLSAEGFMNFIEMMDMIEAGVGQAGKRLGILVNMIERRVNHRTMIDLLDVNFPHEIFETLIQMSIRFQEAPRYGKTLLEYLPSSKWTTAYEQLAMEVINRINKDQLVVQNVKNQEARV